MNKLLLLAVGVGIVLGAWLGWSYQGGERSGCHNPKSDYLNCKALYGWYPNY
jgi:hypothetical protein